MKRWQNNIPEYLISPLTTGFRKISIGVVKDSYNVIPRLSEFIKKAVYGDMDEGFTNTF
ncbi:hypothetical protein [Endozoicomonas atrinae]|uniref:hypothetical protein n=1 Tax=Endozoicomonas atrinae TaxID=1333660 RepID=UPI003AFFCF8E